MFITKQLTQKLSVGSGKDFSYFLLPETVSGYKVIGTQGYDLYGDFDVWVNVSSCMLNSNGKISFKGHNFGGGTAIPTAYITVLYEKIN